MSGQGGRVGLGHSEVVSMGVQWGGGGQWKRSLIFVVAVHD